MPDSSTDCTKQTAAVIKSVLRTYNLDLAQSGSKMATLAKTRPVSKETGFWLDTNDATNKPTRLLIHLKESTDNRLVASLTGEHGDARFAFVNSAQRQVGAVTARIIPALQLEPHVFEFLEQWEWLLLFCFSPALSHGTSAQLLEDLRPERGTFTYRGEEQPYIFAALITLQDENDTFSDMRLAHGGVTYKEATEAVAQFFHTKPQGEELSVIPVFDGCSQEGRTALRNALGSAYQSRMAAADDESEVEPPATIPPAEDLLGLDPAIFRQINGAIRSGKRHIMLYGPPGTGKTTLAEYIAGSLFEEYTLITGSADWTSQDIIGGYQPMGDGRIGFVPGILLRRFDQPIIIDELNRCDIDKVIGPLFTVLSGQRTELPYRVDVGEIDSPSFAILPVWKADRPPHEYAPTDAWRIIATINSIDKASLYQMSYALTRRFAWIYVGLPANLKDFLWDWMISQSILSQDTAELPSDDIPLLTFWNAVNNVRSIGPAPFLDVIRYIASIDPGFDFLSRELSPLQQELYWDGLCLYVLPMLDGIHHHEAMNIAETWSYTLSASEEFTSTIRSRLQERAF